MEAEAWMTTAVLAIRRAWGRREPLTCAVAVRVISYMGKGQHLDSDGLYGGPMDALERAGVLLNDYIVEHNDGSRRRRDAKNPRVEITVSFVDTDEQAQSARPDVARSARADLAAREKAILRNPYGFRFPPDDEP